MESGRPATLSPRCYDLVRRVLLLRVFAVMGAAFLQDRSLVSTVRNFLLLDFLPLGFLIFPFRVRAFHSFGPAPRSVLLRLVQTVMIEVHMNAFLMYFMQMFHLPKYTNDTILNYI